MKLRSLFGLKKDEKKNNVVTTKHEPLSTIHQNKSLEVINRKFMDDMTLLCKPSAAYHTDVKPSQRKPLRSCPGGYANKKQDYYVSADSDSDSIQTTSCQRFQKPSACDGKQNRHQSKHRFRQETSEYGSGDSPISTILRVQPDNSVYGKYRKYKECAQNLYKNNRELERKITNLKQELFQQEKSLHDKQKLIDQLNERCDHLQKQLLFTQKSYMPTNAQAFLYGSGYPPWFTTQPHTFSQAPTLPIDKYPQMQERINFHENASEKFSSHASLSSVSLSHFNTDKF